MNATLSVASLSRKKDLGRGTKLRGDCEKHLYYFDVTCCMLIYILAITFVFGLQMTQGM